MASPGFGEFRSIFSAPQIRIILQFWGLCYFGSAGLGALPPGVNGAPPPLNLGLFHGVTSLGGPHASTRQEVVFAPHLVAEMGEQNGPRGPSGPTHAPSR